MRKFDQSRLIWLEGLAVLVCFIVAIASVYCSGQKERSAEICPVKLVVKIGSVLKSSNNHNREIGRTNIFHIVFSDRGGFNSRERLPNVHDWTAGNHRSLWRISSGRQEAAKRRRGLVRKIGKPFIAVGYCMRANEKARPYRELHSRRPTVVGIVKTEEQWTSHREHTAGISRRVRLRSNVISKDPRSLFNFKVTAQVFPLNIGDTSVDSSSEEGRSSRQRRDAIPKQLLACVLAIILVSGFIGVGKAVDLVNKWGDIVATWVWIASFLAVIASGLLLALVVL
jgi:hypothetical protein